MEFHKALPSRSRCSSNENADSSTIVRSFIFVQFVCSFMCVSDELLAKVVIGVSSVKETGRAHWAAAMGNPGSRVFMWHEATINH